MIVGSYPSRWASVQIVVDESLLSPTEMLAVARSGHPARVPKKTRATGAAAALSFPLVALLQVYSEKIQFDWLTHVRNRFGDEAQGDVALPVHHDLTASRGRPPDRVQLQILPGDANAGKHHAKIFARRAGLYEMRVHLILFTHKPNFHRNEAHQLPVRSFPRRSSQSLGLGAP